MIINDTHGFAFVHIPKCAGTTVRKRLQLFDETDGAFTNRVDEHSELGKIDYTHLPMSILSAYFPNEFVKVKKYWAFSIVRDPYARFPSSMSQCLKRRGRTIGTTHGIETLTKKHFQYELEKTINLLSKYAGKSQYLPVELTHFQRQVDYIYLKESQIVHNIYSMDELDSLWADLSLCLGASLRGATDDVAASNRSRVYRHRRLGMLIEQIRPVLADAASGLPQGLKKTLRELVFVPRDQKFFELFQSDYVRDFIESYYADDIRLFQSVLAGRNRGTAEMGGVLKL